MSRSIVDTYEGGAERHPFYARRSFAWRAAKAPLGPRVQSILEMVVAGGIEPLNIASGCMPEPREQNKLHYLSNIGGAGSDVSS